MERADSIQRLHKVIVRLRSYALIVPLLILAAALAVPWLGLGLSWERQLILIAIFGMATVGVNISYGFAGELSMAQAAMFGAGAYTAGILARHGHNEVFIVLPASALVAAAVGLVSGVPGIRLGGWALAMTSFFLVLLVPDVINIFPKLTGGFAGLAGIPDANLFGTPIGVTGYYLLVIITCAATVTAFRNVILSRHGDAFRVLRQSPILAASLGIPVYRLKLTAYTLSGICAGIAGCLFAFLDNYIAATSFTFGLTVQLVSASILGGAQSIYGALIGTAILELGPLRTTGFDRYSLIAYGAFLLLGGVFLSGGLAGLAGKLTNRLRFRAAPADRRSAPRPDLDRLRGKTLRVAGAGKHFGGNRALTDVTLEAAPGQITAVIGPNGSGKTTLLNLVSGFYSLSDGDIYVGDVRISGRRPEDVARHGIGRTFQTPSIPEGLSVRSVVASGRYERARVGLIAAILRLPKFRQIEREDAQVAQELLDLMGIGHLAQLEAVSLPLGTRRLLEVARALATQPAVLLLDEPASGLSKSETVELAEAIRAIRSAGGTVVLVEHNFPLVLELADHIHVLERGKLIASGIPDDIRRNQQVIDSYLGEEVEAGL